MDTTPNLTMPYILAAQAQKHVTHNEAVRALDAIVQLAVIDRDLTAPPGGPGDGERYLVAASPTGAWAGHAGQIAAYQDGAWAFYVPRAGWRAYVVDEAILLVWSGSAWTEISGGGGGTPAMPAPSRNLLINGDFQINQRGFAGGALSAGVYGFDRWKADTGGANHARSGFNLTLTSGAIVQVIEPAVMGVESFASTQMTVSVQTLTGGDLTITIGSASGTITAGSGVRSVTLTTGAGDTGNLTVKIARSSGTPVFTRAKLEFGAAATPWEPRPAIQELFLCQRYFETSVPAGQVPASYAPGGGGSSIYLSASSTAGSITPIRYLAPKRAAPTVTIRDSVANAARISTYTPGTGWQTNITYSGVFGQTDKGFSLQQNNSSVTALCFDFAAESEL